MRAPCRVEVACGGDARAGHAHVEIADHRISQVHVNACRTKLGRDGAVLRRVLAGEKDNLMSCPARVTCHRLPANACPQHSKTLLVRHIRRSLPYTRDIK